MKICLIGDGRSIHIRRWVDFFADRGHEVHIVTDRPDPAGKATAHRLFFPGPGIGYKVKANQASRIIKKIAPDILHAHFVQGYGQFGAETGFHPFIVTAWGSDIFVYPKKSKSARKNVENTFAKADVVTCMAHNMFDTLLSEYSLGKKLRLVRWGIDTKTFHVGYGAECAALRKELKIPDDALVVLSPRGMLEVYGNHLILEAVPEIVKANPNVYFIFLSGNGSPSYEKSLKRRAKELGVSSNVRFIGGMLSPSELAVYLNLADMSTSLVAFGQFGAVVLESMNCGCAILASDIPVHREKLEHMKNAYLVQLGDKGQISEAILHFAAHPELAEYFAKINIDIVDRTETWEKNAEATEKLYLELIGGKRFKA